jgi:hypothetical protein
MRALMPNNDNNVDWLTLFISRKQAPKPSLFFDLRLGRRLHHSAQVVPDQKEHHKDQQN